jgi:hypothetical protein
MRNGIISSNVHYKPLYENDTMMYATIASEKEREQDCLGEIKIVDVVVLFGN